MTTSKPITRRRVGANTKEEALVMAVDALESVLDFYFGQKRLVPPPSRIKGGQSFVNLPATVVVKVMLHNEMRATGLKKVELAPRMKMAAPNVERIFHAKHVT